MVMEVMSVGDVELAFGVLEPAKDVVEGGAL
jgi:hypothetical protein